MLIPEPVHETEPELVAPFRVEGGAETFETLAIARLEAGRRQRNGDHRSLRIFNARREPVDLKRF